jgi:hypothetical protein
MKRQSRLSHFNHVIVKFARVAKTHVSQLSTPTGGEKLAREDIYHTANKTKKTKKSKKKKENPPGYPWMTDDANRLRCGACVV